MRSLGLVALSLLILAGGCKKGLIKLPKFGSDAPPVETVPMTEKFSAYRSISVHLIAGDDILQSADGTLGGLEAGLIRVTREAKLGPEVLEQGPAVGALDLRGTIQRLDRTEGRGALTLEETAIHFELVDVERERVVTAFDVAERSGSDWWERRFIHLHTKVIKRVEVWLEHRKREEESRHPR